MTLTWLWGNAHMKPFPIRRDAVWTCDYIHSQINMFNGSTGHLSKYVDYLWTLFSQNNTILKLIFFDFAQVTSLKLSNLQACVRPYFKGNFVDIQDLIITQYPKMRLQTHFARSGHKCTWWYLGQIIRLHAVIACRFSSEPPVGAQWCLT